MMVAAQNSPGQTLPNRIIALDGIRGVAVLLVVMHHLAQSTAYEFSYTNAALQLLQIGWCGVEIFFVLSGFLITGILFDSKESPHYFRHFYARRALRIFPLYYGALIFFFLLRSAWPSLDLYGNANQAWLWVYATNIVIALEGFGSFGALDHFWSLAIEEHFYFVWPFLVLALSRERLLALAIAICVLAPAGRALGVLADVSPDAIYALTPLRMDSLAAGAWLALMARSPAGVERLRSPAAAVAILSLVGVAAIVMVRGTTYHSDAYMQVFGYSLLAWFSASLIVLALTRTAFQSFFSLGVLRWLGKYSYGLYVWHPIVFIIVLHTDFARALRANDDPVHQFLSVGLAVAIALAVTIISWQCAEKQFLKLKTRFES
jgi:peptidoglycan/LPS O-acetylase OafA/YrhL